MADTLGNIVNLTNKVPEDSEETIKMWIKHLSLIAFVYDAELDRVSSILKYLSVLSFIIASSASFTNLIQYSVKGDVIIIVTTCVTLITAIISGSVQILGLQESVKICQKYTIEVNKFLSELLSRESLPLSYRGNSDELIIMNKDKFTKILLDAPDISNYFYAKHYKKYLESTRPDIESIRPESDTRV